MTLPITLTVANAHRLNLALGAVAKGFPDPEGKSCPAVATITGKLRVARNLRHIREALEIAENTLVKERDRLVDVETRENPQATELSGLRAIEFARITREVNASTVQLTLEMLEAADLNLDHFHGPDAIEALAALLSCLVLPEPAPHIYLETDDPQVASA